MSYSQNSEEKIILDYFKGKDKGVLLDVGANDGVTFSNSLALIQRGWYAWLIEPDKDAYEKLWERHKEKQNTQVTCYNIAIADKTGDMDFYKSGTHLNKNDTGLLSTLSEKDYDKWKTTTAYTKTTARALTIADLLGDWIPNYFDFITIDAEGMDLVILKQMDLKKLCCKLICVEYNGENKTDFDNYITPFGLNLIHQNNENLIYGK